MGTNNGNLNYNSLGGSSNYKFSDFKLHGVKVEINILYLTTLRDIAAALVGIIGRHANNVLPESKAVATAALSKCGTEFGTKVRLSSTAVLTQCNILSQDCSDTLKALDELVLGIDQVIKGYQSLEQELSTTKSIIVANPYKARL